MVLLLPKVKSFGERAGEALSGGFQQGTSRGIEFQNEIRLAKEKEKTAKAEEKKNLSQTFGNILDQMKSLKEYVGPLNVAALNPFSETSGKRSQINTMRLSLEGLFRDLTLKGQFPKAIYERILKELPQSSDTEQEYLNKIEGIENILSSHYSDEKSPQSSKSKSLEKFDKSNPEHEAKARQLFKTYKNKDKVREILSKEFEGL